MPDPIALLTASPYQETATLVFNPTAAGYNPHASGQYAPGADSQTTLVGIPGKGAIETLPVGATAAFTASLTAVPAGLNPMASQLIWNGQAYTVHSFRVRRFMGAVNGLTLYLKR